MAFTNETPLWHRFDNFAWKVRSVLRLEHTAINGKLQCFKLQLTLGRPDTGYMVWSWTRWKPSGWLQRPVREWHLSEFRDLCRSPCVTLQLAYTLEDKASQMSHIRFRGPSHITNVADELRRMDIGLLTLLIQNVDLKMLHRVMAGLEMKSLCKAPLDFCHTGCHQIKSAEFS